MYLLFSLCLIPPPLLCFVFCFYQTERRCDTDVRGGFDYCASSPVRQLALSDTLTPFPPLALITHNEPLRHTLKTLIEPPFFGLCFFSLPLAFKGAVKVASKRTPVANLWGFLLILPRILLCSLSHSWRMNKKLFKWRCTPNPEATKLRHLI